MTRKTLGPAYAGLLVLIFWHLAARILPVVQDEAYYFQWARFPDFGYFDHPPLVTLTAFSSLLEPGSAFAGRLVNLAVAGLTMVVATLFFKRVGLRDRKALTAAILLAFTNVLGLVFGVLTTPDTWLILAWILALHEAVVAVTDDERRWLTAGAAVGFGLWAKYIMVLMGLVYLWTLVVQTWRAPRGTAVGLRSKWPYLGGVVALLVFLPHVYWNSQNDWITMRFQMRHGFSMERPIMEEKSLPAPLPKTKDSPEAQLAKQFEDLRKATDKEEKKPGPFDAALKSLNRYIGYYGSQIAIWGAFLALFGYAWRKRRAPGRLGTSAGTTVSAAARPLLVAACAVPLIVFGTISLFSKVEANWSGMYVFAAAALLTPIAVRHFRLTVWAAGINALLLGLFIVHARTPFLPVRPHKDRMLIETHGYDQLAAQLKQLDSYVFADSFQLVALMRFYQPDLAVRQWPGITRPSEFLRRAVFSDLDVPALKARGHFYLVTTEETPPRLPEFTAVDLRQIRDCAGAGLQVIDRAHAGALEERCKNPVHVWYLAHYQKAEVQAPQDFGRN